MRRAAAFALRLIDGISAVKRAIVSKTSEKYCMAKSGICYPNQFLFMATMINTKEDVTHYLMTVSRVATSGYDKIRIPKLSSSYNHSGYGKICH